MLQGFYSDNPYVTIDFLLSSFSEAGFDLHNFLSKHCDAVDTDHTTEEEREDPREDNFCFKFIFG